MRVKRVAGNRGTAVHVGGARVRFCWACGCTKVETIKSPLGPLSENAVKLLVRRWRANGVQLSQCKNHPNYYNPVSQVERLNQENPQ